MIRVRVPAAIGQPLLYPGNSLPYVEDFLRMTFGVPTTTYEVDALHARVLDMLFVLRTDHEQNCSAATVRMGRLVARELVRLGLGRRQRAVRSAARWRERGGTADAATHYAAGDDAEGFGRKVKDRHDGVKLMGFGHRVYHSYDPRAAIVICRHVAAPLRVHGPVMAPPPGMWRWCSSGTPTAPGQAVVALAEDRSRCAVGRCGRSFPAAKYHEGAISALARLRRELRQRARRGESGDVTLAAAAGITARWRKCAQAPAASNSDWQAYLAGGAQAMDALAEECSGI